MSRSDILFFATLGIMMTIIIFIVALELEVPTWFNFWWVILVPPAIVFALFPKSKVSRWLTKKVGK